MHIKCKKKLTVLSNLIFLNRNKCALLSEASPWDILRHFGANALFGSPVRIHFEYPFNLNSL